MKLAELLEDRHGDGFQNFTHLVRGEKYRVSFKTNAGKLIPSIQFPNGRTLDVTNWEAGKRFSDYDLELYVKLGNKAEKAREILNSKKLVDIAKNTDEWIIVDHRGFQVGFSYPTKEEATKSPLADLGKITSQKIE